MRFLKYPLLLALTLHSLSAQISTTEIEPQPEKAPVIRESLDRNFLGADVQGYLGQTLYLKAVPEYLREFEYEDFFKDVKAKRTYKKKKRNKSDYDYMVGRYFDVVAIHPHEWFRNDVLELKDKENGNTVYFRYSHEYDTSFPFLVVSFYEKLKEKYAGNEVVLKKQALEKLHPVSATTEKFDPTSTWKCVDVTVEQEHYTLAYLLENEKGERAYVSHKSIVDVDKGKCGIYTKPEADDYRNRLGEKIWDLILESNVVVGFNEEMTRLSWGNPDSINHASYGDQWIYGEQYLYFEKGKLTAFN